MNDKLLECLEQRQGEYVSGERLSELLGVSRTAVWKRIRKLEQQGYVFDSAPRLGYRLAGKPDRLNKERLLERMQTRLFGRRIELLDEVDSTQKAAHAALLAGAGEDTLILAELQTAGRGRLGRVWYSPKGQSVLMSFLIKPDMPLSQAPHMTLLISVALCRAIRRITGLDARIKWPNDILIAGRKTSGILVETLAEATQVRAMVAGIGISANIDPGSFPPDLRHKATSLQAELGGVPVSRESLVAEFFGQFEPLYGLYREEGFAPVRHLWEALTCTLHAAVVMKLPRQGGILEGMAVGLTSEGALLVKDGRGIEHKIVSGEQLFEDP